MATRAESGKPTTKDSRSAAARSTSAGAKVQGRRLKRTKAVGIQDELTQLSVKSCLIARDAAFNLNDLLTNFSRMAFLTVRDCEQELDQIERHIDERMPEAITRVNEDQARELLGCLKFITDLERIGDLLRGVAERVHARGAPPPEEEARQLLEMLDILRAMLDQVHEGFTTRNLDCAMQVLRADAKIDAICHAMFQDVARTQCADGSPKFEVLLMAQAIERAGDHTKNLAEELYSLIEGHTRRHPPKRKPT